MKNVFKKISVLMAIIMIVAIFPLSSVAGSYDDVFKKLTFETFNSWAAGELTSASMRGFAVSPDGKYLYGGLLGSNPTLVQIDIATGEILAEYQLLEDAGSYIKAVAADDRGYVYNGIANKANNGAVFFSICKNDSLEEVYFEEILIEDKVGINGTAVAKVGDKYFMYLVTNYETDSVYCYDVSDVNAPKINEAFGTKGILDLAATHDMVDANNIAVDSDGNLYIAYNTGAGGKGDKIAKFSADGNTMIKNIDLEEAFGCTVYDEYVIASTMNGDVSQICIYDKEDLSLVASYTISDAANLSCAGITNSRIYASDQGFEGGDRILVSSEIAIPVAEEPTYVVTTNEDDIIEYTKETKQNASTSDSYSVLFIFAAALFVGSAVIVRLKKKA